jgi:hypothetical protein
VHSNFITAPDYVENILIIGATQSEIEKIGTVCQNNPHVFNVYLYDPATPNKKWLNRVAFRVDTILLQQNLLEFKVPNPVGFGADCEFKTPDEYFINKQ